MIYGMGAGLLWALETIILAVILSKGVYFVSAQAVFLAPFASAFLNDTFSGLWLLIFRKSYRRYKGTSILPLFKKKNGRLLILSGLFGGPLGMSAYLLSIKYVGASYTAVISGLYPVAGALIARIFLKDRLTKVQLIGILLCIVGVTGMTGAPKDNIKNTVCMLFAFASALSWGLEAVISSIAMKDGDVPYEAALQIRHLTSMICYGALFLPLLHAWSLTLKVLADRNTLSLLLLTAIFETCSYLMYYKSIRMIGAAKAMSLNITYMIWSVFFGVILFRDIPGGYVIISMIILLTGVLFMVRGKPDKV